ncbi:TPA: hypothetical protein ACF33T_004449 [Vibrio parahaemolyticus]
MQLTLNYNGIQYQAYGVDDLRKAGVPEQVISDSIAAEETKIVVELRQAAYVKESDPLYMEWQYDQTAESEKAWRDKVAEIKARYPLPTES